MSCQESRTYCLLDTCLQVSCSTEMAAFLDARFRHLPAVTPCISSVFLEFRAAADKNQHEIERPQGTARSFYEMPKGEACYFDRSDEIYLSFGEGVRALGYAGANRVVFSIVESEPRNLFVASHLMLTVLLVEIQRRRGWYALHAAGFSEHGKAILIPGISGSGKSTLSISLLRGKFDYLSDDMVFFARRAEGLVVGGLVEDVDITEQTAHFFPELDCLLTSPGAMTGTKRQVCPQNVYGTKIVSEAFPTAIVLPRISGKESSVLRRIESDEALLEIVPNVLLTESSACQAHLGVLAGLVKQAACYRLDTGRDFDRIPSLFRELLSCEKEPVCA